jgi:hypothetical protein
MSRQVDFQSLILLSHQLRSSSLKPTIEIGEFAARFEYETAVNELIAKRSALLRSRCPDEALEIEPKVEGKILIYRPSDNLADGAAEYSSNGFFDVNNVPPWDTWFHFSDGSLLSWVPNLLVPLAQEGIDANPEECIRWAEWSTLSSLEA